MPMLEEEAKKRMVKGDPREKIPEGNKGRASEKAGKIFQVNEKYIREVKRLKEARKRMITGINQYSPMEKLPQADKGTSSQQAGKLFNVSEKYVREAKKRMSIGGMNKGVEKVPYLYKGRT